MTDTTAPSTVFKPKPSLPPPPNTAGWRGWVLKNLFDGWFNTLLTLVSAYIVIQLVWMFADWAIVRAMWDAASRRECLDKGTGGACWAGVIDWFPRFIYGRYPAEEVWRVNLGFLILIVWMAPLWMARVRSKVPLAATIVVFYPFLAGFLFSGGEIGWFVQAMAAGGVASFVIVMAGVAVNTLMDRSLSDLLVELAGFSDKPEGAQRNLLVALTFVAFAVAFVLVGSLELPLVRTNRWGGLFLTLVISGVGIASALPSGILLALGRRSSMPIIRVLCVAFIELFRSVPLITVLYMASTMVPLFFPVDTSGEVVDKVVRAIIAVCLFAAAYMAEIVRGGLQAIPRGQYEAAHSLGLSYWKTTGLIIMPQALKLMIPNIVGNFIGLFKDTTLVSIVGLIDFLGMVKAVSADPKWMQLHEEPYFICAAIFFVLCFSMSQYSMYLERKLDTGRRR